MTAPCFGEHGQCDKPGLLAILRTFTTLGHRFVAVPVDLPSASDALTYCADHAVQEFDSQVRLVEQSLHLTT